ncbi:hypothetical protein VPH35_042696 [Triticum aestivum]
MLTAAAPSSAAPPTMTITLAAASLAARKADPAVQGCFAASHKLLCMSSVPASLSPLPTVPVLLVGASSGWPTAPSGLLCSSPSSQPPRPDMDLGPVSPPPEQHLCSEDVVVEVPKTIDGPPAQLPCLGGGRPPAALLSSSPLVSGADADADFLVGPDAACMGLVEDTAGWELVQSCRARLAPRPPSAFMPHHRPRPPAWLWNRCFRCFGKGHRAAECRDPIRCNQCFRSGYRARDGCKPVQPQPYASSVRPLAHSWASIVAPSSTSEKHEATSNMKTSSVPIDVTLQSALGVHSKLLGSDLHCMTSS